MPSESDNFFKFYCPVGPSYRQYFAACLTRFRDVNAGKGLYVNSDCVEGIQKRTCKVPTMIADQLAGTANYYVDRDDVGPGVISRAEMGREQRSADEAARHQANAAKLKIKIVTRTPQQVAADVAAYKRHLAEKEAGGFTYRIQVQRQVDPERRTATDTVTAVPVAKKLPTRSQERGGAMPSLADLLTQAVAEEARA